MPRHMTLSIATIFVVAMTAFVSAGQAAPVTASWPGGLIIDHDCTDLSQIPGEWIEAAQDTVRIHYAHTSHGSQITTGLTRIESANSTYDCTIQTGTLPTDEGALCILDGNPPHTYITPDLYWQGESARAITQNTIDNNAAVTLSLWSWCTQLDYYDEAGAQEYLDAMSMLEAANPTVTFVYMTGNAQAGGSDGYNRWVNNEMIRQYCLDNDKILFDFADLDCWSNGSHSTYEYDDGGTIYAVPIEHPDFNGNEAGHTTFTSCEQKGRAFWWMVAMLAGWNSATTSTSTSTTSTTSTSTSSTTGTTSTTNNLMSTETLFQVSIVAALVLVGVVLYRRRT